MQSSSPPPSITTVQGRLRPHASASQRQAPVLAAFAAAPYWQAVTETCIFAGPLGEVVGEVEAGTVIREVKRFQDHFGGWWIATRASAEEEETEGDDTGTSGDARGSVGADASDVRNGRKGSPIVNNGSGAPSAPQRVFSTLVWVSYNDSHLSPMESLGDAPADWEQVFPTARGSPKSAGHGRALSESAAGGSSAGGMQQRQQQLSRGKRDNDDPSSPKQSSQTAFGGQDPKPFPPADVEGSAASALEKVTVAELQEFVAGSVPGVPSDLDLFSYYWDMVFPSQKEHRGLDIAHSWNHIYQSALEDVLFHFTGTDVESQRRAIFKLQGVVDDFTTACQQYAVLIVERMLEGSSNGASNGTTATTSPVVVPHTEHPRTVFYGDKGIFIQLCCDTPQGFFGGEAMAQKFVQRRFQSARVLSRVAPKYLLSTTLSALVDFEGYRLRVVCVPPIHRQNNCIYGGTLGDHKADEPPPAVVQKLLATLSRGLNLNQVDIPPTGPIDGDVLSNALKTLPVELQVHVGRDRRLYLLNGDRIVPMNCLPVTSGVDKPSLVPAQHPVVDLSLAGLRPEICLSWAEPINVNTGVQGCGALADVKGAWAMADYLKTSAITACAGIIGMHLPVPASLQLPAIVCNKCSNGIDGDELRFVVCRSPQQCCCVCTSCYAGAVVEGSTTVDTAKSDERTQSRSSPVFRDAVKCWGSNEGARPVDSVVLQPSVTELMHANGLNMNLLAYVYHRLPATSRRFVAHFVELEMVARGASHLLRASLRGCVTAVEAKKMVEGFFLSLLENAGPKAERMWAKELGPYIEKHFRGIVEPFSTTALSKERLLERMQSLTGVVFTPESLASFSKAPTSGPGGAESGPFIQLQAITPRTRVVLAIPSVALDSSAAAEKARLDVEALNTLMESLLLFWIGYAPPDCDERLQPQYLHTLNELHGV